MRARRFEWEGAAETAAALRVWAVETGPRVDIAPIQSAVQGEGDDAVLRLTAKFDAPGVTLGSLRVDPADAEAALAVPDPGVRQALGGRPPHNPPGAGGQPGGAPAPPPPAGPAGSPRG